MSTTIVQAVCVVCETRFDVPSQRGRKPITCSVTCKRARATDNKREASNATSRGEDKPYNYRRPNVSTEDDEYLALSGNELDGMIDRSRKLWEYENLRLRKPRYTEDMPKDGWIYEGSPGVMESGFIADDYFDSERDPLSLIDLENREVYRAWLTGNRIRSAWDVGRTASHHIPVIGSGKPCRQATPHHLRTHFACSERPTGAMKPFTWDFPFNT
jgi:hypothetical protein